jgi:hypothetical protein
MRSSYKQRPEKVIYVEQWQNWLELLSFMLYHEEKYFIHETS